MQRNRKTNNKEIMKKLLVTSIVLLLIIISTVFTFWKEKGRSIYVQQSNAIFMVEEYNNDDDSNHIPGYGKSYLGFKEAIGFKESQGRYAIVNSLGYIGKYQFGKSTLATLRIHNTNYFLYNSILQEKAFKANCSYNMWLLQDEIDQYVGTTIRGVDITESGIIAAAHLAGAGSVKRFLKSKSNQIIIDAYGTTIQQYLVLFAGYDLSYVKPTKRPVL